MIIPFQTDSLTAEEVQNIRKDFPILSLKIGEKPLVYFDNAATTQKPTDVLEKIRLYYETENANIHRGVHTLSERATHHYESVRSKVQKWIGAKDQKEIIFVRGTTEGINLVAQTFGRQQLKAGDEVVITTLEHHSNIVPWQMVCEATGALLRVAPINKKGEILLDEYEKILSERTKLVAVGHVSNSLGTINPVREMIRLAHQKGAKVLIDGAQAIPHLSVNVQELDCDFYVLSGHKFFAPTGIGVLYGKSELLEKMPPYQGGGDMIAQVRFEKTTYNVLPYKFEAGTPNIEGVIGLGAAIDYIQKIGIHRIENYERELLREATEKIQTLDDVRLIGTANEKAGVLSFLIDDIHPHDIGTILDSEGIAIRTGHHCTMPLMNWFGVPATARASFAFYNTKEEINLLIEGLKKVFKLMRG